MLHKRQYEYVNIRICKHKGYLIVTHTKPIFSYINTLRVRDMVDFNMVFMFKVNNNLHPDHMC